MTARRIGKPTIDEVSETCVDVLEFRSSDVPDQRVAPLAPISDRATVVDHPDDESGVDVGLHLRLPPIEVEPGRPAVDEHHHREGPARVSRGHKEAVNPLAVRILEVP